MLKRLVIVTILLSMVLHSASRLGLLSYLHQQRHQIAYALGVISEIPIAMCNSDYDFNSDITIVETADDSESTVPPVAFHANEIQLYFNGYLDVALDPTRFCINAKQPVFIERVYSEPPLSIFHPPS